MCPGPRLIQAPPLRPLGAAMKGSVSVKARTTALLTSHCPLPRHRCPTHVTLSPHVTLPSPAPFVCTYLSPTGTETQPLDVRPSPHPRQDLVRRWAASRELRVRPGPPAGNCACALGRQ